MHETAIRHQMARIVGLLLALAVVADRACRAPRPVRVFVLSLLLPAQAVALDFVCCQAGLPAPPESDDSDLAVLAARFCLLAFALAAIVAGWPRDAPVPFVHFACNAIVGPNGAACAKPFDTS